MESLQPHLNVLEISQLTPPESLAQPSMRLNFFDILWLYAGAVERIFFFSFPCSTSHFINSILPDLKSSLSQALNIFYPLYGKIRRSLECEKKYELSYVEDDSVSFIVAQLDSEDFNELSSYDARDIKRLLALRPELLPSTSNDEAKPVLAVQVTLFPNHGIAIGIAVHHAACDGHTSIRFLSTWASIYRTGTSSFTPIFDRKLISDPRDIYSTYFNAIAPLPEAIPPDNMVSRTFTLSSAHIKRLKDIIATKTANENDSSQHHYSTTVVTYALVWVCVVRSRNLSSDQTAHLAFAVNCGNGLTPPIPPEYFGNRINVLFVQANAGELIQDQGVVVAAKAISKVIKKFREDALYGAERLFDEWISIASHRPLSVAGSPQLKVYDIDFGWGKTKKVEVTSIIGTGAMSLAESRGDQGGVEIGFILQQDEMEHFATQIFNALQVLSAEFDIGGLKTFGCYLF